MALRIGGLVVRGEIDNTTRYSVRGWLELQGCDRPLLLHLTGDCDSDLAGRRIVFSTPSRKRSGDAADLKRLAWQQVGPTVAMTATKRVRVPMCSARECDIRTSVGEPPPMVWKSCLHLEWYSQNGRVVIEIPDSAVDFLDEEEETDGPAYVNTLGAEGENAATDEAARTDINAASAEPDWDREDDDEGDDEEDEAEDPYGLIPADLKAQLDASFDREGQEESAPNAESRRLEMARVDELLEKDSGRPISCLFDRETRLADLADLGDDVAEEAFKTLLAQLAQHGIAVDVCKHLTPRQAYELVLRDISKEARFFPQLRRTQWVQHFMTSDFCGQCAAESGKNSEGADMLTDHPSGGAGDDLAAS